jgi:hypothetical protein
MANPKRQLLPGALRVGDSAVTVHERHRHSSSHNLAASDSQPTTMVTSNRMRNVKWFVTDGPFAETHELLGG